MTNQKPRKQKLSKSQRIALRKAEERKRRGRPKRQIRVAVANEDNAVGMYGVREDGTKVLDPRAEQMNELFAGAEQSNTPAQSVKALVELTKREMKHNPETLQIGLFTLFRRLGIHEEEGNQELEELYQQEIDTLQRDGL